jgi:hypothetical protein
MSLVFDWSLKMLTNEPQNTVVIDRITTYAAEVARGEHSVKPGDPIHITPAAQAGDVVWQGDLGLIVSDRIPSGYLKIEKLEEKHKQLVPGNTEGAKHCLSSIDGVSLHYPPNWGPASINGPAFVSTKDLSVVHPVHGDVTVPAGTVIECLYQREWDAEQARERRAAD